MLVLNDEEEIFLIENLRKSPSIKSYVLEMLDITKGEQFKKLRRGDDAEEAVVDVIQKTGKALLEEWAKNKTQETEKRAADLQGYRPHKKKI